MGLFTLEDPSGLRCSQNLKSHIIPNFDSTTILLNPKPQYVPCSANFYSMYLLTVQWSCHNCGSRIGCHSWGNITAFTANCKMNWVTHTWIFSLVSESLLEISIRTNDTCSLSSGIGEKLLPTSSHHKQQDPEGCKVCMLLLPNLDSQPFNY